MADETAKDRKKVTKMRHGPVRSFERLAHNRRGRRASLVGCRALFRPKGAVEVTKQRAQARDYLDIDALIRHGVELPQVLTAGAAVYGRGFNPMLTLKALSYFDDVLWLAADVRERLEAAVRAVDPANLPMPTPHVRRDNGRAP